MAGMKKKDVTDQEIEESMRPVLEELSQYFKPRVRLGYQPPKKKANPRNKKSQPVKEKVNLSSEQLSYLGNIHEKPNLSVTARGKTQFGYSADKNTRLKGSLIEAGLVEAFTVDLGRSFGGRVTLLRLTRQGYRAIGKTPPPEREGLHKRASLEHVFWQEFLVESYRAKGFKAFMEYAQNGKRADVGVIRGNETVAVEVELSPKNLLPNFKKNIDAGFDRTVIACKNSAVRKQAEKQLAVFIDRNPEYAGKAKLVLLNEFPFVKKLHREIRGI